MNNPVGSICPSKTLASAFLCVFLLFLSSCQNSSIPYAGKEHYKQLALVFDLGSGDGGGGSGEDEGSDIAKLMKAAAAGDVDLLRSLIPLVGDISVQDEEGNTALHHAAKNDRLACIRLLREAGINLNVQNEAGKKALHVAAAGSHVLTIEELVGGTTNEEIRKNIEKALLETVKEGHAECIEGFLRAEPGAISTTEEGKSLVYLAATNGHVQCVKKLKENGIDLDKELLKNVARITAEFLRPLKETGVNLDAKDPLGDTILYRAVLRGYYKKIKILADAGVDLNARNDQGYTALQEAVRFNKPKCIEALAEAGINLDLTDRQGDTALHIAVTRNDISCVRALVASRADLNIRNGSGYTARELAALKGYTECERMLRNAGASLY